MMRDFSVDNQLKFTMNGIFNKILTSKNFNTESVTFSEWADEYGDIYIIPTMESNFANVLGYKMITENSAAVSDKNVASILNVVMIEEVDMAVQGFPQSFVDLTSVDMEIFNPVKFELKRSYRENEHGKFVLNGSNWESEDLLPNIFDQDQFLFVEIDKYSGGYQYATTITLLTTATVTVTERNLPTTNFESSRGSFNTGVYETGESVSSGTNTNIAESTTFVESSTMTAIGRDTNIAEFTTFIESSTMSTTGNSMAGSVGSVISVTSPIFHSTHLLSSNSVQDAITSSADFHLTSINIPSTLPNYYNSSVKTGFLFHSKVPSTTISSTISRLINSNSSASGGVIGTLVSRLPYSNRSLSNGALNNSHVESWNSILGIVIVFVSLLVLF
ncbi:hypothetical protein DAMA08_002670 [Martiniozyma asiatica (nom. inval.)]|nr:hypothetical protein DAMA08_002670 [Martiniozyma asiatica]